MLLEKRNLIDFIIEVNNKCVGLDLTDAKNSSNEKIAHLLCGVANEELALAFMNGKEDTVVPFMDNVRYNSEKSLPYILEAITRFCKSRC